MRSFEGFKLWQHTYAIAVEICYQFRECKNYSLRDQLIKSSIFLSSNIAEVAQHFSRKEFTQCLAYANGSAGKRRTQIMMAHKYF